MLYPDVLRDISRDVPLIRTRTFFDTYTKIITICGDNVKYFILILAENRNLWYIIIHMRRLLRLRDYMILKDTDMGTVRLILTIALIIISVVLTAIVLMQEGKSQGLGAIAGAAETYWGKNKGRSMEGRLVKLTTILCVVFFVLCTLLDMKVL